MDETEVVGMAIAAGTVIKGRYEALKLLAQDSVSSDWLAFDRRRNGPVLLKAIDSSEEAGRKLADHVRRQADRLNRLQDPCLVHIYDIAAQEGLTCVVMEPVAGRTLSELLQERGALPIVDALAILRSTAEALQSLSSSHVAHQDIAPGSLKVLLDDEGRPASVQLLQFGTAEGLPYYASPEEAEGLKTDERSDLYSLGVVFYEMLTAHMPFDQGSADGVLHKRLAAPLPPIGAYRSDLTEEQVQWLEEILHRCLAKSPEQRYASPSEVVAAADKTLARFQSDKMPEGGRAPAPPHCLATLTTPSGRVHRITKERARVGRDAGGVVNDIDLKPEDGSRSVHRRHLRLECRAGQWYVQLEPGATNPTTVRGQTLEQGKRVRLRDGDEICAAGVSMIFRVGGSSE